MTIKNFLCIFVAVQLSMLVVIGLNAFGFDIPLLRQVIGLIYIFFIPGLIILRILRLQKLGVIETLLYTIGLSVVFSMLLGLFVNTIYPHFGILRPLSILPLIITMTIVISLLSIWAYKRGKDFLLDYQLNFKSVLSPPCLLVVLLPLLSALGAKILDNYGNNSVAMSLPVIISVVILLSVIFRNKLPKEYYPIAVFSISLAILLSRTLACPYTMGKCDIHQEMYFFNLTLEHGYWNGGNPYHPVSQMMSITIFPTICSAVAGIQPELLAKLISPLLWALLLVGLYQIYATHIKEIGGSGAFLAACFIMAQAFFYLNGEVIRVVYARFFIVLLLFLILSKRSDFNTRILVIIFACGLVLSHYSNCYMFLIILCVFWLVNSGMDRYKRTAIKGQMNLISVNFIILFVVLTFFWYMFTAGGASFNSAIGFGDHVVSSLADFFSFEERSHFVEMAIGARQPSLLIGVIRRDITWCTLFFLIIGFLSSIVQFLRGKFDRGYSLLAITFMVLLAINIIAPFASVGLGVRRVYVLSLYLLAPFFIIGGYTVLSVITRLMAHISKFHTAPTHHFPDWKLPLISLILISLFLCEIGFAYQIGGAPEASHLSLNADCMDHDIDYSYSQDVAAVRWFTTKCDSSSICADWWAGGGTPLLASYGSLFSYLNPHCSWNFYRESGMKIPKSDYFYLCHLNVVKGKTICRNETAGRLEYVNFQDTALAQDVLPNRNKIYDNRGAEVFK